MNTASDIVTSIQQQRPSYAAVEKGIVLLLLDDVSTACTLTPTGKEKIGQG